MKKIFTAIALLLVICSSCSDKHEVTAEQLTQFYKSYITSDIVDVEMESELLSESITKEALEKIYRDGNSTNCDQLIRAQDINKTALATVTAEHLENDWYMVSYFWVKGDSSTLTQIPMKALTVDGKLQITYIPHSINGLKYGDDLLGYPTRTQISDISQASEQEFLESFIDVYLSNYCSMTLNLYPNLKELRAQYFTENGLSEFKKAEDDWLIDYMEGFDLLIDDFDFDPMWYNSLKISPLGNSKYQLSFTKGNYPRKIEITTTKSPKSYLIDSIKVVK